MLMTRTCSNADELHLKMFSVIRGLLLSLLILGRFDMVLLRFNKHLVTNFASVACHLDYY